MYWPSPSSPISSPASSPSPFVDSSPPSSPSIEYTELDHDSPVQDPFAGSTKATKLPRLYEKKRSISPTPVVQTPKRSRFDSYAPPNSHEFHVSSDTSTANSSLELDRTEEIFSNALNEVYEKSCGHVDLSEKNLTHIPISFLEGLKLFVALSARSELDYAGSEYVSHKINLVGDTRRFSGRTGSSSESTFRTHSLAISSGAPREQICLFFHSNAISRLPSQLFDVDRLTVLSLRRNKLTQIPPQISRLKSLRTLNIANNELKYLPSEMLSLSLTSLLLHPNPFIPEPVDPSPTRRTLSRARTSISQSMLLERPRKSSPVVAVLPQVIPLDELCFRTLFSSPYNSAEDETLLRAHYTLPFDERCFSHPFPPSVQHRLHVGYPKSLMNYTGDQDTSADNPTSVTGIGVCPSPRHDAAEKKPIFFMHAEERYTWENTIAGVKDLGGVPIRWRGCQSGCLDFLNSNEPTKAPFGSGDPALSSSSPAESDAEIVQPLQVTLGAFTMDEFGD